MKSFFYLLIATSLLGVTLGSPANAASALIVKKTLCEYASQPINIDRPNPRFSWILASDTRSQKQSAYRVLVAQNREDLVGDSNLLWDSGQIKSAQTVHVVYGAKNLKSNTRYFWKVIVWNQDDQPSESKPTEFWTALLDDNDWTAHWIGAGPAKELMPPEGFFMSNEKGNPLARKVRHKGQSLLLRREFRCDESISHARLFVTGLGYYELFLNGQKVGDHVLAPAKTNYRKQVLYDTYDVTDQITTGTNAIGIHLGNGWFNPYKKWWREYRMQWFGAKRAIMQLHVTYANGKTDIIRTDANWKQSSGPVLFNCIYDGEVYDASREKDGWSKTGYNDSKWRPVNLMEAPGGELVSHTMQPIKVTQKITPVKDWSEGGGRIYDMGQNFSGWAKIAVRGKKGTKVVLRFAEDLQADGSLDITSNEHAKATATYYLKGKGLEIYEPRFSFFGFRYVEIRGEPRLPKIAGVQGCVVQSACATNGKFECGNPLINKIHQATIWSQRSNMMGYPLDCPQRDERLGWLGDAQVSVEQSMFNMDMPLYLQNWLSGIKSNQNEKTGDLPIISPRPYIQDEGVEWSSTYIIILWRYYLQYGDTDILADHYPTMKRYMEFLASQADNFIIKKGWIGDWGSLVEGWQEGEPESIPTAFYYYNSTLLSQIAKVLGKADDANHFATQAESIKQAFHEAYFNSETNNYNDGSQMANAFPLFLGIVPEELSDNVLDNLLDDILNKHDGHLTTGVLGSKYMIDALVDSGKTDVAYGLVVQTGYPSWGHMVKDRTTMSEFWGLKQSHNHVMMGSIDAIFYKAFAGIQIDEQHPGFEKFIIKPYIPKSLPYVRASIETVRGKIVSAWEQDEEYFKLKLKIPVNTTAKVFVPSEDEKQVFEGGVEANESDGVTFVTSGDGTSLFVVESGKYEFVVKK